MSKSSSPNPALFGFLLSNFVLFRFLNVHQLSIICLKKGHLEQLVMVSGTWLLVITKNSYVTIIIGKPKYLSNIERLKFKL